MALIVLDSAAVAISRGPNRGFVQRISEIEGFPPGLHILLPFEGDYAREVCRSINEAMDAKIVVASPTDIEQEVRRSGLNVTE